ncbi:peptide chain release factor 2 [Candidatus Peribacteria bacterium RIFCSPLOWO2_01_FULL_51_18]|nr:MAG: peptide chain release factor 2 [Candidatus Peribacteria bacterium RIFCSPLOWO2_01_FULL_51_18]
MEVLEKEVSGPDIWNDRRHAEELFNKIKALKKQWLPILNLLAETKDLHELATAGRAEDIPELEKEYKLIAEKWSVAERALYLGGKYDLGNAYLSITSGAGGTEAQDWAGMIGRMYLRYAERKEWKTEVVERTDGQEAGIKSMTIHVAGDAAYGHLKCERGTHRLVRLSPFNAKNLRQTSFALVEVLPDMSGTNEIEVRQEDLRIDTYRSGGAGGQHVNKTDSAVRLTHIPTGMVVACQNERSQLQNRERAMNMLKAKLLEKKQAEEEAEKKRLKGSHVSADFGSQIRSYVLHPYQMVKDLRTNYETSDTTGVLDGDLDILIEAELKREAREE